LFNFKRCGKFPGLNQARRFNILLAKTVFEYRCRVIVIPKITCFYEVQEELGCPILGCLPE
jgi:hypothetical protein